jgi:hypothetical protein
VSHEHPASVRLLGPSFVGPGSRHGQPEDLLPESVSYVARASLSPTLQSYPGTQWGVARAASPVLTWSNLQVPPADLKSGKSPQGLSSAP